MQPSNLLARHALKAMKKIVVLALLIATLHSNAQKQTVVEQYCEMIANPPFVTSTPNIKLSFGSKTLEKKFKYLSDSIYKMDLPMEALNFMSKNGWKLVKYYHEKEGLSSPLIFKVYLLKKQFTLRELQ